MPWSSQNGGGGPWGGGNNQGPWGQGPQPPRGGGGGKPPDLDEILRRGQERLRGVLPGGGGSSSFIAIVVVAVLVVLWLFKAVYTVQPDERGVELRFGQPKQQISMPGLHFHWWPFETVEFAPIVEQEMNIGGERTGTNSGLMLTGDQNIVMVDFKVLYAVTDPKKYLFDVAEVAGHASPGLRERHARGRRPAAGAGHLPRPPRGDRDGSPRHHPEHHGRLQGGHHDQHRVDRGRIAAARSRRRLRRGAARRAGRGPLQAGGAAILQPEARPGARRGGPDPRGRERLQAEGRQRGEGPVAALPVGLQRLQAGAGSHAPPDVPRYDGAGAAGQQQGDHRPEGQRPERRAVSAAA